MIFGTTNQGRLRPGRCPTNPICPFSTFSQITEELPAGFPDLQMMALIGRRGHSGSKRDVRRWTFAVLVVIEMAGLWERLTGRQRRARKAERQAAEQAWAAEWQRQAREA